MPSTVAVTVLSWISRYWATAATPAVRQLASATSTYSAGVAPWSSEAKHSGWSASKLNVDRWGCSWPRPEKLSTVERLWVPCTHEQVARQVNSAASGAAVSASRAPSSAAVLTPLSIGVSVMVIGCLLVGDVVGVVVGMSARHGRRPEAMTNSPGTR